jgi:hypothetical protein
LSGGELLLFELARDTGQVLTRKTGKKGNVTYAVGKSIHCMPPSSLISIPSQAASEAGKSFFVSRSIINWVLYHV